MTIFIISGPPASGKNTVADVLARRLSRTAVIDTDALRRMVSVNDDIDTDSQWLAALNACSLAENFVEAGCDVVIAETLTDESAEFYRARLEAHEIRVVLLMPTIEEIHRRLISHTDYLSRGDVGAIYQQQQEFTAYDDTIDNSVIEPDAVADFILSRSGSGVTASN